MLIFSVPYLVVSLKKYHSFIFFILGKELLLPILNISKDKNVNKHMYV